jgi:hybrid cluster-associated redox disulfide protein
MNKIEIVTSTTIVKDLLECFPQVQQVFFDKGLLCAGCPTEAFHTLADVSSEYYLDLNQLLQCINEAIKENKLP